MKGCAVRPPVRRSSRPSDSNRYRPSGDIAGSVDSIVVAGWISLDGPTSGNVAEVEVGPAKRNEHGPAIAQSSKSTPLTDASTTAPTAIACNRPPRVKE